MRIPYFFGLLAALSAGVFGSAAYSSTILITTSAPFETDQTNTTGNTHLGSNSGSGATGYTYDRVGYRTTTTEVSMDIPFLLPTIPAGQVITAANVSVSTINQTSNKPVAHADLYGATTLTTLPPDGNPPANGGTVANEPYYYSGSTADTDSSVTLLESNFLDATNGATSHNFTSTDFTTFLQSLYTNDPNAAGKYVTLRLSYDSTTYTPAQRYEILTSQGSGNPLPGIFSPTLSITMPEPASLSFLAIGGAGLIRRRRVR